MRFYVYRSSSQDPRFNLAVEEYFQRHIPEDTILLYLWCNANTVVIGRTQNPWRECDFDFMDRHGILLSRRTTGGGAVYHDSSNLNYSFIVSKELYDVDRQFSVILDAVRLLGLRGERSGRNDLMVDGRKFSGNAFSKLYQGALHHGTILIDTNVEMMQGALQVSAVKMKTHGVQSVSSRVVNLRELIPDLSVEKMGAAISTAFQREYGPATTVPFSSTEKEVQEIAAHNADREWLMGNYQKFSFQLEHRFSWGEFQLNANAENGKLKEIEVYSDSLDPEFILQIRSLLSDKTAGINEICRQVTANFQDDPYKSYADEIVRWLKER